MPYGGTIIKVIVFDLTIDNLLELQGLTGSITLVIHYNYSYNS